MAATAETVSGSVRRPILRVVSGWVLCLVLAVVFLFTGGMKLLSKPAAVHEFTEVGLGQWFRYFTGMLELTGAVWILFPKWSRWAALLLGVVMVGAIIAHLTVLHSSPALPVVLLALLAISAWLRR